MLNTEKDTKLAALPRRRDQSFATLFKRYALGFDRANTQQFIHEKLVEKEKLSTTEVSVSEIAYQLGFEHPQSSSKFFKTKTHLSPLEFKHSFN